MANQWILSIHGTLLLIFLMVLHIETKCIFETNKNSVDVIICKDVTIENLSSEIGNVYNKTHTDRHNTQLKLTNINFISLNSSVTPETITQIKSVKVINNSEPIKQNSFSYLKNCQSLELYQNNIVYFAGFSNARLEELTIEDSNVKYITNVCKRSAKLTYLNLSRNNISIIQAKTFSNCHMLKFLDLSHNYIIEIKDSAFVGLYNLTILHLNHNRLTNISSSTFNYQLSPYKLYKISNLRPDHNSLGHIEVYTFVDYSEIKQLNLTNSWISAIEQGFFRGLKVLEVLYISSNPIINLPPKSFQDLHNIKSLHLSKSNLRILQKDQFVGLDRVTHINISATKIKIIEKGALNSIYDLKNFDVSHNLISGIPCNISDESLYSLSYLNLSNNVIESIAYCAFENFPSLSEIYLNNNSIKHLSPYTFTRLTKLEVLNVADNKFKYLDSYFTDMFKSFPQLKSLLLSGNPWDCSYFNTTVMQLHLDMHGSEHFDNLACIHYTELKENVTSVSHKDKIGSENSASITWHIIVTICLIVVTSLELIFVCIIYVYDNTNICIKSE